MHAPGSSKNPEEHVSWAAFLGLLSMAVCSFAIGTTEFVTAGLLPNLAHDFSVSIPVAGFAISGYALGVGISGPLLTAATICMSRKYVLAGLMTLFVLGSIISALAPTFAVLMLGRILSAFCHGAFFGIGAVVAVGMVGPGRGASAIAWMFTGLTLANVIGVPMGTLLGQHLGWRSAFWAIAVLGIIGLVGLIALVPRKIAIPSTHLWQELMVFKRPQVWLALLITALGFGGLITSFTYIAPMMTDVAGFSSSSVSWLVAIYGVGLVIGNMLGGKAADRALMPTMYILLTSLAVVLFAFVFTAHYRVPAMITLFLLGAVGFGVVSPLQKYMLNKAEGAPTLASTANISAFNLGIALGVYLGGVAIDAGLGYTSPNWIGAILTVVGLGLVIVSNLRNVQKRF